MSVLITSVFNCASDWLAISSSLSCIFSGALKCSVIWAIFFFLSWRVCYFKGWSLRCSPGRGNAGCCAVTLYVEEGLRGSNGARSTLHQTLSPPLLPTIKLGSSGAGSRLGGLVRTLGPVGLSNDLSHEAGVSPAAAPTPTSVFNQRFEALFPRARALGCVVCFAPRCSSRFICVRMWGCGVLPAALPALFSATLSAALSVYLHKCGAAGSASGQPACPIRPTLRQSQSATASHSHVSPLHPGARLRPSYRSR